MKIIPAMYIKNGRCVTVFQEQFRSTEIYSQPVQTLAREWEEQGASSLHLVDMDGVLVGHSVNEAAIKEISGAVCIPVVAGGGIRSINDIEKILNLGISRVVISTKAVGNPGFIREAVNTFGDHRIIAAINVKDGMVVTNGWEKPSRQTAMMTALEMREAGIKMIQYKELARVGEDSSACIEHIKDIIHIQGIKIIAAGDITSLKELELIQQAGADGAIVDRALFEKRIDLREAIHLFETGRAGGAYGL